MKRPSRSRVRSEASSRGLRTSGTSAELSALNESADSGAGVPAARQSKQLYLAGVTSRYDQLLGSVTLAQLGQGFPEDSWQSVVRNGWATLPLHLLLADKRFLRVCLYANLADLGVSAERADTYESAQGDRSYDCGHGWLRRPAFTMNRCELRGDPRAVARLKLQIIGATLAGACHGQASHLYCAYTHACWVVPRVAGGARGCQGVAVRARCIGPAMPQAYHTLDQQGTGLCGDSPTNLQAHCGSVRAQIARSGTDGRQASSAERSRAVAAAI